MGNNLKLILLLLLVISFNSILAQCKSDCIIKDINEAKYNLLKTNIINTKYETYQKKIFEKKAEYL